MQLQATQTYLKINTQTGSGGPICYVRAAVCVGGGGGTGRSSKAPWPASVAGLGAPGSVRDLVSETRVGVIKSV